MLNNSKLLPVLLTLIFYLACLFTALNMNLDERVTALMPDSDPEINDFKAFITQVPAAEALYIQIDTSTPNPELLARAGDAFYNSIKETPFFTRVFYRFSRESVFHLLEFVRKNRFLLLNQKDMLLVEAGMDITDMNSMLQDIKRQLLSPSAAFTARDLSSDPFGLSSIVLNKLAAFKSEMPGAQAGDTLIINTRGTSLLMVASPKFPAVETGESREMFRQLDRAREKITRTFGHKVQIGFSGVHLATLDNSATIKSDVKRTLFVLTVGILTVGFLFFSRRLHAILIFVPTMVGLAFAGAAAAFFADRISGIAIGCGALLVGITVDFGIHILFHADTLGTASTDHIIKKLRRPVLTGACTTMAAFGCLVFSSLPGQRQMGLISILGIFGAAVFALFVLKYFIALRPWKPSAPLISMVNASDALMTFRKRHMTMLLIFCLVLTACGITGLGRFSFDGDLDALNHLSPRNQKDMDNFIATWGQDASTLFVVQGRNIEEALWKNDALFQTLERMKTENLVTGIASLSDILPSRVTQEARYDALKALFSGPRRHLLKNDLTRAGLENGFSGDAFMPFINDLESVVNARHVPGFSIDDLESTVIFPLVESKLIQKEDKVMVLTTVKIKDKQRIPEISATIKTMFPGTLVIDKPYLIGKITGLVAGEFKQFLIWAAFSMVTVLILFQRRIRVVAATVIPVFLSAVITAGLLGLADISINLISLIVVIFVFGVGVDFSIFLVHHGIAGTQDGPQVTPGAVIICAMTTIGGFASLCFARHKALFSIGAAGLTGMSISLLMALIIIPFLTQRWGLHMDTATAAGQGGIRRKNGNRTI